MGVTREELEAALRRDRDDGAAYDVYADFLIANGDPLGELIALERRGDPSLARRIAELRAQLVRRREDSEFTDDAFRNDFATEWRWGLWRSVTISCSTGTTDGQYDAPALARFAFAHPACVALRELRYELFDWRFAYASDVPPVLAAAEGLAWARDLHTLHVGQSDGREPLETGSRIGRCGAAISRIFPGLRELALFGDDADLAELELPRLTALRVGPPELRTALVAELCAARLPAVEHVELDAIEDPWLAPDALAPDAFAPIVDGVFPTLRSLSVRGNGVLDELARALPGSPLAARLEHLELRLTDGAALALAGLPRLRSLMIRGIAEPTRAALARRFPRASVSARD